MRRVGSVLVAPSPKSHWLVVKSPAEVLVNCTASGGAPRVGVAVKSAVRVFCHTPAPLA